MDKSLKTANSIRVVPLHDIAIKAGLLEYVEELRKAGYNRLFPELKHNRAKGYGKAPGSWFNERFLGKKLKVPRTGKKCFHSFRHNFITALDRLTLHERVLQQLAGHQRGVSQSGARYAKDRDAAALQPELNRLSFPCLEQLHKFDADAGVKAVAAALRRKR